jgi:hypothetical protein
MYFPHPEQRTTPERDRVAFTAIASMSDIGQPFRFCQQIDSVFSEEVAVVYRVHGSQAEPVMEGAKRHNPVVPLRCPPDLVCVTNDMMRLDRCAATDEARQLPYRA